MNKFSRLTDDLSERGFSELVMRWNMGKMLCQKLRQDWAEDPRAAEALAVYEDQTERLRKAVVKKRRELREANGWEKPEPTVIEAKVAIMGAKSARKDN